MSICGSSSGVAGAKDALSNKKNTQTAPNEMENNKKRSRRVLITRLGQ